MTTCQRKIPEYLWKKMRFVPRVFQRFMVAGSKWRTNSIFFSGKLEAELPEARRGFEGAKTIDNWPWAFKDFKAKGYATLFSEDEPAYGTFQYRLHGFGEAPTDHYGRCFWQAAAKGHCVGSKPQHVVHFEYVQNFLEAYREKLKFGFAFLSAVSHGNLNSVYLAGQDFHELLKRLQSENLLNDTMLVVMSDHGFRFGEARTALQGKLEERLPLLSVTLPPWFRNKFPQLVQNLEHNTNLLVTPFDLHATLKHILSYPELPQRLPRATSLFDLIPESRDCATAGVAEHYCPCVRWQPVDKDHWSIKQSAQIAVAHINNMTSSDADGVTLCAHLGLAEVVSAFQKIPKAKMQQHLGAADIHGRVAKFADEPLPITDCMYQLEIRTRPGDARFEVPVTDINGQFHVAGEPSRVNKYGDQPKCIQDKKPHLRKYCFCKWGLVLTQCNFLIEDDVASVFGSRPDCPKGISKNPPIEKWIRRNFPRPIWTKFTYAIFTAIFDGAINSSRSCEPGFSSDPKTCPAFMEWFMNDSFPFEHFQVYTLFKPFGKLEKLLVPDNVLFTSSLTANLTAAPHNMKMLAFDLEHSKRYGNHGSKGTESILELSPTSSPSGSTRYQWTLCLS